jgi:hypothetical protein
MILLKVVVEVPARPVEDGIAEPGPDGDGIGVVRRRRAPRGPAPAAEVVECQVEEFSGRELVPLR